MIIVSAQLTLILALCCSLGYNKLGEKGGTAVAEALKVNACLLNLK